MDSIKRIDLEQTIEKYSDLLYRTCFLILRNSHDAEDVMQETFIKYMRADVEFRDEEHKKAWLLKVSQNKCKDMLRFHKVHAYIPYEEIQEHIVSHDFVDVEDIEEVIDIAKLSYKYKSVILIYYIEGYSVKETAEILGITETAVKSRLKRAREKLKGTFEKIYKEEIN